MKILFIGDVVGFFGCKAVYENLHKIKSKNKIDFVIANGENSSVTNGITVKAAEYLLNAGVDAITGGNHTFKKRDFFDYLNKSNEILRPANYPNGTPGKGFLKFDLFHTKICVINLSGVVYLESLACPFETFDKILGQADDCKVKIIDFHAEATAEKRAMGFYVDGKVSAIFGTHTHVQTSDEEILHNGTAYITDVGMTGIANSVLGVKSEISIMRMKGKIPLKFEHADSGFCKMECAIVEIDEINGKSTKIERLRFKFD
ncbi:MAG: TIGR00282 family metallophosphoesterase [Firmicutes bacterium]|nr:TIGR00282 family metallophosphoesterase [Bacillota bacterium]